MERDGFGRPFIDGSEQTPDDLLCLRCGIVPYKGRNPYGVHMFEFNRASDPSHISAFALCDECALDVWEFITPRLTQHPRYVAKMDQYLASIPEQRARWNSEVPPEYMINEV